MTSKQEESGKRLLTITVNLLDNGALEMHCPSETGALLHRDRVLRAWKMVRDHAIRETEKGG